MSDSSLSIQVSQSGYLAPVADLNTILTIHQAKKEFIEKIFREGIDYGPIPGNDKKTLLKAGAEKLSSLFGLHPVFIDVNTVEDWTGIDHGGEIFLMYRQKCQLYLGDNIIASADGSCNSWEKKYRYRQMQRVCPECGKAAIKKSQYPPKNKALGNVPGWYCFAKIGGCGAEFGVTDPAIVNQQTGQEKNQDVAEQANTILKMAQKRALVAATLIATNVSDYFTQDMEDFIDVAAVTVSEPVTKSEPIGTLPHLRSQNP
jgi:hypothetical protein